MPQFPATLRLVKAFAAGEVLSFRTAWRSVWADGWLYEKEFSVWVTKMEEVMQADGTRRHRPLMAIVSRSRGVL